jgi:hypothetical protein
MVAFFLFVCSTCFAGSYRGPPGRLPSGGAPTAPAATEPPPLRGTPRRHLPDERPGTSAACNRRLPRDAVAGDRATAAAAAGRPSRGRPDDAPGYRRAGRGGHAGSALAARPPCRRAWSARWVLELGAATPRMGLGMNVVAAAPALPIAVEGDSVGSPWRGWPRGRLPSHGMPNQCQRSSPQALAWPPAKDGGHGGPSSSFRVTSTTLQPCCRAVTSTGVSLGRLKGGSARQRRRRRVR